MPQLSATFAKCVASHVGTPINDAAAAELAAHLEMRLRDTIRLALRLARRARRKRIARCDVDDAGRSASREAEVWMSAFARHAATGRNAGELLPLDSGGIHEAPLPKLPLDIGLRVEWLAVNGAPVAGRSALGSHGGLFSTPGLPSAGPGPEAAAPLPGLHVGPSSLLSKEQLALLHRIVAVLDGGEESARWRSLLPPLCRREALAPLRPFLAHFLSRQVPLRLANSPPAELHALLGVLEAISLAPGAELYLHQCLPCAFLLCLSPALGGQLRRGYRAAHCLDVRRRAAALIGEVVLSHKDSIPELCAEACSTFEQALRRSPPLPVVTGAILGLQALGPRCIERVLIPLAQDGLMPTLAQAVRNAAEALGEGTPGGPSQKKARLAPPLWGEVADAGEGRAGTHATLLGAVSVLARQAGLPNHGKSEAEATASASLQSAAQLYEATADAFDTDPAPLLAALAAHPALDDSSKLQLRDARNKLTAQI